MGSLFISNISQDDAGLYECIASNDNGQIRARGRVTVKGKINMTWITQLKFLVYKKKNTDRGIVSITRLIS